MRINERKQREVGPNKKMAYLIDLKTIAIGKIGMLIIYAVKPVMKDCLSLRTTRTVIPLLCPEN